MIHVPLSTCRINDLVRKFAKYNPARKTVPTKRQNTVEASSFGSEYIALRICAEKVEALRYKLRCFGVPIDGPRDIFCDNRSVLTNSIVPTSVLNKRHNAICYHRVREAQAAGAIRVGWIEGKFNVADLFTKTTLSNEAKRTFVQQISITKSRLCQECRFPL